MESSQNGTSNRQPFPANVHEEANTYRDEINLIDYFRVLWKRRYFIILGSVLPALVVGLITFSRPRDYKMTYLYDVGLDEKAYKILLDKFYSAENLDKLVSKLRETGLDEYAQEITGANTDEALKALVDFEEVKGTLLAMTIMGKPKEYMQRIASIVRDDFEKVIPIYSVKKGLSSTIANFKAPVDDIEENRFSLELELERKKATLAKLKNLKPWDLGKIPSDIVLQFNNVGANSAYLPLPYQIQAIESQIINLEESIRANQEKYDYYKSLLSLNQSLFDEVRNKTSSYYTIQQFRLFLLGSVKEVEKEELKDYLSSYTKRIENRIATSTPVIENPSIYAVSKGTINKTVKVFGVLLMITMLVSFLLEALKKSQARAS